MSLQMKKLAVLAAKEAGNILLENFGKKKIIKSKSGGELVTDSDIESEEKIIGLIKENYPDHSIISEEKGTLKKNSDYTWIIDPLDGTHNFIHGLPLFAVSIALEYKGKIVLGVVNIPFFDEVYLAEKGKGAYCNGTKIFVSKKNLKEAFLLYGSRLLKKGEIEKPSFFNLVDSVFRTRIIGTTAVCLTLVASGKAEAYVTLGKPEDVAGGCLILEEAKGTITDLNGGSWNPYMKMFVASNGKTHEKMLNILRSEKS
ncbi:inositol monophosphatase [Candidatus Bathyarchaeota archaeon]|nr:inositol monophosphatase [Candidatus Bathyarchaeota archaeon]